MFWVSDPCVAGSESGISNLPSTWIRRSRELTCGHRHTCTLMSGSARTCYAAREASPATSDTTQPTRARSAAELTIITVRTVHVASPVPTTHLWTQRGRESKIGSVAIARPPLRIAHAAAHRSANAPHRLHTLEAKVWFWAIFRHVQVETIGYRTLRK